MLAAQSPLSRDLVADVQAVLFSESPDPSALESRLTWSLGLSAAEARSLIYQVALELNRRLFPPVAKLELIHTEGCNLACTYCFEKDMLGVRKMRPEVMRAAIDLLFDYSGEETELNIVHFGGEPTLNFSAIRAATEYVEQQAARRGKSVRFDMTTNGVLMDEAMAEYCARHRIMVLLSIDGLAPTHDRFRRDRRGNGSFAQAMRGFQILKQTQGWIGVKMTVMPENSARLLEDVVGLYALGINQFVIGYATGITWPPEAMRVYTEQLTKVFQWYRESPRDDLRIAEFEENHQDSAFFGCQAGRNSITATVDGEISPCAKVLALDNKKLVAKLGDVQYGLTHLKNRQALVSCSQLQAACERQGIADEFRGGCFASNYQSSGDIFVPNLQDHTFSVMKRNVCAGCSAHG